MTAVQAIWKIITNTKTMGRKKTNHIFFRHAIDNLITSHAILIALQNMNNNINNTASIAIRVYPKPKYKSTYFAYSSLI